MTVFDPTSTRVAIIAGNGVLPGEVYEELQSRSRAPLLIGISGEIEPALSGQAHSILTYGQLGQLFSLLKTESIQHVIFAGGIRKRPDFKRLKLDLVTVKELPTVLKIVLGGDNTVLEKIAAYFSKRNLEVVGVHQVLPDLLVREGMLAGRMPGKASRASLERAFDAAKTIGALDAGQAAICEDGRIVALEGAEGTDAMIERVRELRKAGRLSSEPGISVLAKCMKPKQDMRADLPAMGPDTIRSAKAAGIKGIVMEADCSLILKRDETIRLAKSENIFIMGMRANPELLRGARK